MTEVEQAEQALAAALDLEAEFRWDHEEAVRQVEAARGRLAAAKAAEAAS